MRSFLLLALCGSTALASQQATTTFRAIPTLDSHIDDGQNILPALLNGKAADPQAKCPGYTAKHVKKTKAGISALLYLAGKACNVYGTDIQQLQLVVEYQAQDRLNVQIYPASVPDNEKFWYKVQDGYSPAIDGSHPVGPSGSDLAFNYVASPFSFTITRKSNKDVLFSTKGSKLVFENQFIEFKTSLPKNNNIYGLGDSINAKFNLNGDNMTIYAADIGDGQDANLYGAHPFYYDHRYKNGKGVASGTYLKNFHGQDILLRDESLTWRTIGGAIDLYFFAGPTPSQVHESYIKAIGLPALQQYWTFGFHQCRWGYANVSELQYVVDRYREANIPLETIWTDIDYMDQYRDFTLDPYTFSEPVFTPFLEKLHAGGQHYIPIVDAAIYVPNPNNDSDAYPTYDRGHAEKVFLSNPDGSEYIGAVWPGFTVFPDWSAKKVQQWWTDEYSRFYEILKFDGIWLDMNEVSSFCVGSCGTGRIAENPVHPPFKLPGEKNNRVLGYPEGFEKTNKTQAASASAAASAQNSANSAPATTTPIFAIPTVVPNERNVNYPPYAIQNFQGNHDLAVHAVSPNATHSDGAQEYDVHSLWGSLEIKATYNALLKSIPHKRPFIIGRSTAPGSGRYAGHWGGDNDSVFYYMRKSIQQALNFAMFGIPMFGVDTCGFNGNSDLELCSRWMQMSAFFTFYRNHNVLSADSQEAYIWAEVAEASRTAMSIRYSLLPYIYTLFHTAHTTGATVMKALMWEFPDDETLTNNDYQFMLGPGIMVLPVIEQGVTEVTGQFPGGISTAWYDWYTGARVKGTGPASNLTVAAPLGHIPVYVLGGNILPMQVPGYTTADSRKNPFEVLVALTPEGKASGSLYIDDGESVNVKDSIYATATASGNKLSVKVTHTGNLDSSFNTKLSSVTILGVASKPSKVSFGNTKVSFTYTNGKLVVSGLDKCTSKGAWSGDWNLSW